MARGFTKLVSSISNPAKTLTRRLEYITTWKQVVKEGATRVPTFYGAASNSRIHWQLFAWFVVVFSSSMFGTAHLLVFLLSISPTPTESLVWLYSSGFIYFTPLFVMIFYDTHRLGRPRLPIEQLAASIFLGIYILARILLFVLGFTTLRDLPPGTFNTVHWPLIFTRN